MTSFLVMTGILIALGLALVLLPLARPRKAEGGMPHFQSNLLIHRDQLKQQIAMLSELMPPAKPALMEAKGTATLSGTVNLAPQLTAKVKPDDAVFIFARAEKGSRMPLAILNTSFRELPLTFTLDDSSAMAPGIKLSSADALWLSEVAPVV